MATLHARNIPDDLYARLRRRAEANSRSISAELADILDGALPSERFRRRQAAILADLDRLRRRQRMGPPFVVEALREVRNR